MYAVVKTGGKQYRVAKDDIIKVEKLEGTDGDQVVLEDVLMVANGGDVTVGAPLVDGASVSAQILEQTRADKIVIFKKRRRQNYRRKKGHRQHLTVLKVTDILTGGAKPSKVAAKPAPKKEAPKDAAPKKEAPKKAAPKKEAAPKPAPAGEVTESAPKQYDSAPAQVDDLKLIKGVGPKLEETLNELGIYTFEQIADWNAENVAFVDARLKFKGRIERDDWISKAKVLAKEKK